MSLHNRQTLGQFFGPLYGNTPLREGQPTFWDFSYALRERGSWHLKEFYNTFERGAANICRFFKCPFRRGAANVCGFFKWSLKRGAANFCGFFNHLSSKGVANVCGFFKCPFRRGVTNVCRFFEWPFKRREGQPMFVDFLIIPLAKGRPMFVDF